MTPVDVLGALGSVPVHVLLGMAGALGGALLLLAGVAVVLTYRGL